MPRSPTLNPADAMLQAAAAGAADRLLILGRGTTELVCAALRRGCVAAMGSVAPPRHPDRADLVLAPAIASAEEAGAVADCARRALTGGGRLVLRLGAGLRDGAREVAARLERDGFRRLRLRAQAEGDILLTCHLPHAIPRRSPAR